MPWADLSVSPAVLTPAAADAAAATLDTGVYITAGKIGASIIPAMLPLYELLFENFSNPGAGQTATWKDRAGTTRLYQPTDVNKPTATASGVQFAASTAMLFSTPSNNEDRSLIFCLNLDNPGYEESLLLGDGPGSSSCFGWDDNTQGPRLLAGSDSRYASNLKRTDLRGVVRTAILRQSRRTSPYNSLNISGTDGTFPSGVAFAMNFFLYQMGAFGATARSLRGKVLSFVEFDRWITDAECAAVRADFAARYGAV